MSRWGSLIALIALIVGLLSGCNREPEGKGPQFGSIPPPSGVQVYHLAVHPLHNPAKLTQACQPLVDYLNR